MRPAVLLLLIAAGCSGTQAPPTTASSATPALPPPIMDDGLPLRGLPEQSLPPAGCALFLWQAGAPGRKLVLMARGDNNSARIALAEGVRDLARTAASGTQLGGFAPASRFADATVTIEWSLTIEQRADVTNGAVIPQGTLSYTPVSGDALALPVTGIIGCR